MGLWSFWLILAIGFLIIEVLSMSTTCLYIGLGALAAMICAFLGGEWIATILTFVIATALLYLVTYRWHKKLITYLHKGVPEVPTGMDALIGRTGTVISSPDSLRMRIDGDVWQVRPSNSAVTLRPGDRVRVVGYDSIILTVELLADSPVAAGNT